MERGKHKILTSVVIVINIASIIVIFQIFIKLYKNDMDEDFDKNHSQCFDSVNVIS